MCNKYRYSHEFECKLGNNCTEPCIRTNSNYNEAEPSGIYPSNTWRVQLFPKLHDNTMSCDYLLII